MPETRDYAAEYQRRIARRLGMSLAEARQKGVSRQAARGHAPREKAATAARQRARGALTETDRRFLRRQALRASPLYGDLAGGTGRLIQETTERRIARARVVYEAMTPAERDQVRRDQSRLARSYGRRQRPQSELYKTFVPDLEAAPALLFFYH